jgi:hypothetical protein
VVAWWRNVLRGAMNGTQAGLLLNLLAAVLLGLTSLFGTSPGSLGTERTTLEMPIWQLVNASGWVLMFVGFWVQWLNAGERTR